MNALAFTLKGRTAFFKKPDVNVNTYFTFNNIHKIALCGLLGAIIGLQGHSQQKNDEKYPEFYEKLKDLKIAIVPNAPKGYFVKKIQVFNNGVGYASKEDGGNLIVREQWLENPSWEIYVLDDSEENKENLDAIKKLKEYMKNSWCEYIPYLGKNDHQAQIKNVRIAEVKKTDEKHIDSLFIANDLKLSQGTFDEKDSYFYREFLPWGLNEHMNSYEFKEVYFTNHRVKNIDQVDNVFECEGKIINFN